MKTPQQKAQEICLNALRGLTNGGARNAVRAMEESVRRAIATARAEGYTAGVRARDEWSLDRDAAGARDRALEHLGIDQDTLVRVNL